jgi:sn-glycerol 3-phosphate transport system substrate-binding protein
VTSRSRVQEGQHVSISTSRRTLVKQAAALGAASTLFPVPNIISAQGSNVELIFWTNFGSGVNGEAQAKLIEDFNAQSNGVTVTSSLYADYEETANAILTGLPSGDVPHIAVVSDVWWFPLYLRGALTDLTSMVDTPEDYIQPLYIEYQRHGGQWAVPFSRSTPLFYFNRTALDAAGLDESIFAKWSTFRDNAHDLVEGAGLDYSFGFDDPAWTLHGALWAFGGNYSDAEFNILIDEEAGIQTGEFMREFVQDYSAAALTDITANFAAGVVGASILSTGSLGTVTDGAQIDFGVAMLPEELKFGCPTGGAGLGILSSVTEEERQAAMDFITFSTNTANAAYWSQTTGYMPVRTSAVDSEEYQAFLEANPNNRTAIEQLPLTQPQDAARVFIPNGNEILIDAWEQILVNNLPAADAFSEVAAILEEEKQPVVEAIAQIEG